MVRFTRNLVYWCLMMHHMQTCHHFSKFSELQSSFGRLLYQFTDTGLLVLIMSPRTQSRGDILLFYVSFFFSLLLCRPSTKSGRHIVILPFLCYYYYYYYSFFLSNDFCPAQFSEMLGPFVMKLHRNNKTPCVEVLLNFGIFKMAAVAMVTDKIRKILKLHISQYLLEQSFQNFVGLFLALSSRNLCKKIGIGWTNFSAVAMETKKGGYFWKFNFLPQNCSKLHGIDLHKSCKN